ncbi:hypothetical protein PoB_006888700 [Plakobranchus ocellatus]|uniref:Uncharacterized protein n=1 Tax=Plakobranchus ocellatus TaxID=259542 RepID=A0AAV4DEC4_9GAST|nr:hypothetical protein PoB_006888700 [Plakobranchus ocellatus]
MTKTEVTSLATFHTSRRQHCHVRFLEGFGTHLGIGRLPTAHTPPNTVFSSSTIQKSRESGFYPAVVRLYDIHKGKRYLTLAEKKIVD